MHGWNCQTVLGHAFYLPNAQVHPIAAAVELLSSLLDAPLAKSRQLADYEDERRPRTFEKRADSSRGEVLLNHTSELCLGS